MLRWLRLAFVILFVSLSVRAQAPDPRQIQELNQKAIEALTAKRYDDGIELLKKVLALLPEDKGTAYNLACACSLKQDLDQAFSWMEKSCTWGWGIGAGSLATDTKTKLTEVDMCKNDPDLENMRKDPRWEPLITKIASNAARHEARLKKAEAYAATAAVYVPEAAKALAEKPVLVVVHDEGGTKDQIVAGFWKEVADELGFVLIAPSGRVPLGEEPAEKGMAWFENLGEYVSNKDAWKIEKPIYESLATYKKTEKIDRTRVVIAGDGGMGSLVAFGSALNSPALYKAVVGLDGLFEAQLVKDKGPAAAKMGQHAALFLDLSLLGENGAQAKAAAAKYLGDAGLGTVTAYTKKADDPKARVKLVADAVRELLKPPAPPPAANPAPK